MKIITGSDHGGFELKEHIKKYLIDQGIEVDDVGTFSTESVDYPDIAHKAIEAYRNGDYQYGILICGTGQGMTITANKHKGIRAALCTNSYLARMARMHNDANFLCMGGRVTGVEVAKEIVNVFINTEFEGGRHQRRISKIEKYYEMS